MKSSDMFDVPPLKKSHPIWNSLVIKITLALLLTLWRNPYLNSFNIQKLLQQEVYIGLFVWFVIILIGLSLIEAVAMLLFSIVSSVVKLLGRWMQPGLDEE